MTAIALAESCGDSQFHATVGEDSRGLWRVNTVTYAELAERCDLYDPGQNARAAFVMSRGGLDLSPWPAAQGGAAARYLSYQDEARAAAAAYGDGISHEVPLGPVDAEYGVPPAVPVAPAETEYAHPFDVKGVVGDQS